MFCNIFSCFYKKNEPDIDKIKLKRIKLLPLYDVYIRKKNSKLNLFINKCKCI